MVRHALIGMMLIILTTVVGIQQFQISTNNSIVDKFMEEQIAFDVEVLKAFRNLDKKLKKLSKEENIRWLYYTGP